MTRPHDPSRPEHAFALVELIIVLVILGILSALIIPSFSSPRRNSQHRDAVATAHSLQRAVEAFRIDHQGRVPTRGTPTNDTPADWINAVQGPSDPSGNASYLRGPLPDAVRDGNVLLRIRLDSGVLEVQGESPTAKYTVEYSPVGTENYIIRVLDTTHPNSAPVCELPERPSRASTAPPLC